MDLASIIGILFGWACVVISILLTPGASVGLFVDYPSMFIVFGGTLAALLMSFSFRDLALLGRVLRAAFFQSLPAMPKLIADFRRYADIARRDGILALEKVAGEIKASLSLLGDAVAAGDVGVAAEVGDQLGHRRERLEEGGAKHAAQERQVAEGEAHQEGGEGAAEDDEAEG